MVGLENLQEGKKMKLLILDKDGTLVNTKSGQKFVNKPWDQEPIKNTQKGVEFYRNNGWSIVIASNQGGVLHEHKTLEIAILEMQFCIELFPQIHEAYFCPDNGSSCYRVWDTDYIRYDKNHSTGYELGVVGKFRKPDPGMLLLASYIEDADTVTYIGDREEDREAANNADIEFISAQEWHKYLDNL